LTPSARLACAASSVVAEDLRAFLERREAELLDRYKTLHDELEPIEVELAELRAAMRAAGIKAQRTPSVRSPMTMKMMVMRALEHHFPGGATTAEFVVFFN
jgi:hypothetical protein